MEYVVWAIGGLLVGAVLAWLVATKRAQSELVSKIGEAERRSVTAETKTAAAEATRSSFANSVMRCAKRRTMSFND